MAGSVTTATAGAGDEVFHELQEIARLTRYPDQEGEGRDRLIRFLDQYSGVSAELPIVDSLCARFGLYPYMSPVALPDEASALALEYHSPQSLAKLGFTFHAQQQRIYQRLMDGHSVVLSAPTSFGKSVIVDALVASQKWQNIVLLVPTIALLDEIRRRLSHLGTGYTIVTHPAQEWGQRNVFVMTQERFLELPESPPVGLFVIDEFYKLGSAEKEGTRRSLLNIAWSQLRATGAQYYLTGPNIDSLHEDVDSDLRENLVTTDFKTVVVELEDRSHIEEGVAQLEDLKTLLTAESEEQNLVFVGSPQKVANLTSEVVGVKRGDLVDQLAVWVAENYHPDWYVVHALRRGIGVHTGLLPRSLQRATVRLFQRGDIGLLICTSTLIEGVNTVAKNVIIFEKAIDRKPLDFFTFSNIRGRAGRMFQHFVGHVITYSKPPDDSATEVDIPIETQSSLAALSTLIQLHEDDLSEESRERLAAVLEQKVLSLDTIRKNKGLDPERLVETASEIVRMSADQRDLLAWTGVPSAAQARQVLELGFDSLLQSHQRRGMNFNMLWGRLQAARVSGGDIREMVERQLPYARPGQTPSDVVDDVLRFQRNWMGFTIPAMLRGVQSVQSEVLGEHGLARGNYEYFLREVEGLYLPNNLADLEEYGLPLPLAKKLVQYGLRGDDLPAILVSLQTVAASEGTRRALSEVELWFLDDVVGGLLQETQPQTSGSNP
ncbi:DEAD/DEAH box helicase [Microbacterium terrisoli]|uniref:DEAD/DEAH box helicase n=1 Tax=Microbacterium terrisoli TaxID=3242192 RepID=UPI002805338C|nr:DEAD/DEAH box helicase [Microbacterium protaetiae]